MFELNVRFTVDTLDDSPELDLPIAATEVVVKGHPSRYSRSAKVNHWNYGKDFGEVSYAALEAGLEEITRKVYEHKEAFLMLPKQYKKDLWVCIYTNEERIGMDLETETVRMLSELGASLSLRQTFMGEDGGEAPE